MTILELSNYSYILARKLQLGAHLGASLSHCLKICCSPSSTLPLLFLALFVTPSFVTPRSSMPPCLPVLPVAPLMSHHALICAATTVRSRYVAVS